MKTRQEMVYDFMIALAPNIDNIYNRMKEDSDGEVTVMDVVETMYEYATTMADRYLESLC